MCNCALIFENCKCVWFSCLPFLHQVGVLTEKRQTKIEVLNIRGYIRLFPEREDNWTIIKTVEQNKLSFSEKIFFTLTASPLPPLGFWTLEPSILI